MSKLVDFFSLLGDLFVNPYLQNNTGHIPHGSSSHSEFLGDLLVAHYSFLQYFSAIILSNSIST